jgi:CTP-dependent riboflavin kinase
MCIKKRNGFKMMMNKIPKISGKLIQGARKAAFFAGLSWVQQQCREKIGFIPFSGTLNLEIKGFEVELLKGIPDRFWEELIPEDKNFCSAKILPVFIKDIKGAVILPEAAVNIHGSHVIEILAPVKLRQALGLNDGDLVDISNSKCGT